jgi:hypothetical protein
MKKNLTLFVLLITYSFFGQFSPQTKSITKKYYSDFDDVESVTPGLLKDKGFTNDDELYQFLEDLQKKHPSKITITYIGNSQEGRKVPLVKISNNSSEEKIKVFFQGGLHGNEPASTEGLLYLLAQLLNDEKNQNILDHIDLVIIPMANIDGYLDHDRYADNGLDLNRDQTKLMAPESVFLKKAYMDFYPEVALDFHEYRPYRRDYSKLGDFGVTSLYDVMFLPSSNLNVPESLRKLTKDVFLENTKASLEENGLTHHPYTSTTKYKGEIHFNQGSLNARSNATNYALSNAISAIIEVRGVGLGRTSFRRRVKTTYLIAKSFLETAIINKQKVKNTISSVLKDDKDIVVSSRKRAYKEKFKVIDLNTDEILNLDVVIRKANKVKATLIRKRPKGYLLDASQTLLIEKLRILGAQVEKLTTSKEYNVEAFKITSYNRDAKKYEKMNLQDVRTKLITQEKTFDVGTYIISFPQNNSNLIVEVLEPEAPNSFVSFGLLKTEKGAILPIYRIIK